MDERRISLITADQRTTTPRSKTDYDDHDTDGDTVMIMLMTIIMTTRMMNVQDRLPKFSGNPQT